MGLCLIAAGSGALSLWIAVLKVAIGLGLVIFVHELGHFAVAKLCGVKCEKFYLGFDIAGLKLCKFTWGETEYGIGILPLGGYVKMLGQEDNPARLREEIERARLKQTAEATAEPQGEDSTGNGDPGAADQKPAEAGRPEADKNRQHAANESPQPQTDEIDVEAAKQALFDPRSYLAKSVPKRMAIISAGVIMNLVFAFICAAIAFELGVRRLECGVGELLPGAAAWQQSMKVGDQILEVAGRKTENFRDMRGAVSLGDDLKEGLQIVAKRPKLQRPLTFTVKPDSSGLLPMIGIANPRTTTLLSEEPATRPGSAAANATPNFQSGDTIKKVKIADEKKVAIADKKSDDPPISYAELHAYLALHPDKTLTVTVERPATGDEKTKRTGDAGQDGESDRKTTAPPPRITIDVDPNPMRRLGLVMEMGEICAVQQGLPGSPSPAEAAGIKVGDLIRRIDYPPLGDPVPTGDPMTLADRLRRRAGETVVLSVERETEEGLVSIPVTLRPADSYEEPMAEGDPVTVPALGIAYRVLNRVHSTLDPEYYPAAKAGLRAGDEIVEAKLIPPDKQTMAEFGVKQKKVTLKFDEKRRNWPALIYALQTSLPGTEVELTYVRSEEEHTVRLSPEPAKDWFSPDRGWLFEPEDYYETAKSFGHALSLGAEETVDATLLVYRFLRKLGTQVSFKALGGPVTIFAVAKRAAEQSTSDLLIFLTLLSANLAVINFLPIPLLDGGHMLLLVWEGIRGKPADERVQMVLTYIGLILILSLMIWVIGLDVVRWYSGF